MVTPEVRERCAEEAYYSASRYAADKFGSKALPWNNVEAKEGYRSMSDAIIGILEDEGLLVHKD